MKKLIISATLIAVALGSGAILAAQGEQDHSQMHQPGVNAESSMPGAHGQHGRNAHGHMAQMHARMSAHMTQHGEHGRGTGAEHASSGQSAENCPMHGQNSGS
jgi:hypothetical protein